MVDIKIMTKEQIGEKILVVTGLLVDYKKNNKEDDAGFALGELYAYMTVLGLEKQFRECKDGNWLAFANKVLAELLEINVEEIKTEMTTA